MEYLTEDQIVEDILDRADDDAIRSWLTVPREDVILAHHSTGQAIRNHYGLWHKENPHVVLDDGHHDRFPDQMSHRIMERVWERARQIAPARGIPIPDPVQMSDDVPSDSGTSSA